MLYGLAEGQARDAVPHPAAAAAGAPAAGAPVARRGEAAQEAGQVAAPVAVHAGQRLVHRGAGGGGAGVGVGVGRGRAAPRQKVGQRCFKNLRCACSLGLLPGSYSLTCFIS